MNAILALVTLAATSGPNLQAILERIRIEQDVPGVSAVVTLHGEILFAGASGVADLETERTMTANTAVYAGSVSKILTAILVLQLAEAGELSLDDVVEGVAVKSIDDFPSPTISQLLSHAAGLEREGDFGYWFSANFPDKRALEDYLFGTGLRAAPGSSFHYSNVGYAALGLVIERATGQRYEEVLQKRVLGPLGMASSGVLEPGADIAAGYSPINSVLPNEQQPFAGLGRVVGDRRVREYHNAKAMTPAFGIYTSAHDLSRLAHFLLGGENDEVLSDRMRLQMLTAQPSGWGLGIRIGTYKNRPIARHGGWFAAHQSHVLLDLQSGIAVVVQANSDSASPGKIAEALLDGALKNNL